MVPNRWLIVGGSLSALAALLHVAIILGGPDWYRFFGAGEGMARGAERGSLYPVLLTLGIALVLAVCSAYALAGAGLVRRLPLMRAALAVIACVYLLRGLALFPILILRPDLVDGFTVWSSLIVLAYGVTHAVGTWQAWAALSKQPRLAAS
ncbi:MAG TPA: hypothetical protein VF582_08670 [Allosphingosinicella sp.]|jgi:hypothetical protein